MNARDYAIKAHGDQKYGDQPYVVHLDDVADILRSWFFADGSNHVAAGYLHDVVEDTFITFDDLSHSFGERVAQLVYACTGEGQTRADKMASIYQKVSADPDAAIVKLADRIANVEAADPLSKHAARYLREDSDFTACIAPLVSSERWRRYEVAISSLILRGPE